MVAAIPPALKAADVARFAQRAGQVEKAKPVVAYWCNYWIVEQILSKQLHKKDADCMNYTMELMDKLEQTKSDFHDNDAIMDDMAGLAYIEKFAQETFQRADNAMKANKASRQTADTFQAAATFLDLCQIWGPFEPETASKIKFAKYHALRIAKAIKANEDPNLSNPAPEPQPTLDPNDPDVQMLNSLGESVRYQDASRQPSVVEVPDEYDRLQGQLANRSTRGESFHPSRAPSVPPPSAQDYQLPTPREPEENYYHDSAPPEVSPLAPSTADRTMSDGGGYFPRVSESDDEVTDSRMPDAVAEDERSSSMVLPDFSSLPPPTPSAAPDFRSLQHRPMDSLHSFPPPEMDKSSTSPPSHISVPSYPSAPPPAVSAPSYRPYPPPTASRQIPQTPIQPPLPMPGAPVKQAPLPRAMAPPQVVGQAYLTDEEAILNAQKHARWAISALNFEDADTAVKELREALEALGAS